MTRGMKKSTLSYATRGSAGADLVAAKEVLIPAGGTVLVDTPTTGAELDLNNIRLNTTALLVPRSGLAANHGVTVLNSPGTIDPDYQGVIKVLLHNFSDVHYSVHKGDKIAQLVLVPFVRIYDAPVASEERGEGGFGSTGR